MDIVGFLIFLLFALIILAIIYWLWQSFIVAHVPVPLNWAIPMIVAILFVIYLLLILLQRIPLPAFKF